jgi:hypothetical protein
MDPVTRLITYSSSEWETFVDEWVSSLEATYQSVLRYTGAGDMGIDVAGFTDGLFLKGVWDNYQCKHYGSALGPSVAWVEIGKVLWHSFNGDYAPPRAYYFVAPRGTSTSLTKLLGDPAKLKAGLLGAWDRGVRNNIGVDPIELTGDFALYVDNFDFSIFRPVSVRSIIEQHRTTPYFIPRFGGGLPPRPKVGAPPSDISTDESNYVSRLFDAYADHLKTPITSLGALKSHATLNEHFHRSREAFYHAESLRVFARDKVEPGVFESLQNEIYAGVVDTRDAPHADGYQCVVEVTNVAQAMSLDAHPLSPSLMATDRRGICHQLANEERLKWTK